MSDVKPPTLRWRLRWAAGGAVAGMLLISAAWGLTEVIKSPQEVLAEAEPPPPSEITYPVERRVLEGQVAIPGVVRGRRTIVGKVPIENRRDVETQRRAVVLVDGTLFRGSTASSPAANGAVVVNLLRDVEVPNGTAVEIRFPLETPRTGSLVVPVSALFTDSGGGHAVVVLRSGRQRQISVQIEASAGGFVAVSPTPSDALVEGDDVIVSEPR